MRIRYEPRCTHLVVLAVKRTEKSLGAIASDGYSSLSHSPSPSPSLSPSTPSPLTSHLSPLTSHLSPLTSHLPPFTLPLGAIASGCWLLTRQWVVESLEAGTWLPEASYEITAATYQMEACTFGKGTLWLGAPRHHRLRRQGGADGAFSGMRVAVACGTQPDHQTLRKILACGGADVVMEEALAQALAPGQQPPTAVIVPRGATSATCSMMGEARLHGIPCVPPEYIIEQLTQHSPGSLGAHAI